MHRAVLVFLAVAVLAALLFLASILPIPTHRIAVAQNLDAVPIRPVPQQRADEPAGPIPLPGLGDPAPPPAAGRGNPIPLATDCLAAIGETAARTRISEGLLLAIAQLESGLERWAVTTAGQREVFDARDKAIAALQIQIDAGATPIRIGCMGIDVAGPASPFPRPAAGFDARLNVETAAARLLRMQQRTGSWAAAIGGYRGDEDPADQQYYRCRVLQELARLRGQQPQACEEPETAQVPGASSPVRRPGEPRVVPLDGGLRGLPRDEGDGPLIVRGLDGLRQLGRSRVPAAEPPSFAPSGDARVEVFRSRPTIAGAAAEALPGSPENRSAAVGPGDARGSGTRVQHVTGTEGSGTVVRELR